MGADIHCYCQTKDNLNNTGWYTVPIYTICENQIELVSPYNSRNYEIFGWLTNGLVRCDMPEELCPIDALGLPYDLNDNDNLIGKEFNYWGDDGFCQSCVTLDKVIAHYKKLKAFAATHENAQYLVDFVEVFINKIRNFINLLYPWKQDDEIRIVYWFDN